MKGKGVEYKVMGGHSSWSGKHTVQYAGDASQNCTRETYIILLTNVSPINLILKTFEELSRG